MNEKIRSGQKKEWEKPQLVRLGVETTKTGIGGSSADFLNYDPTSPTATNTNSS